MRTANAAGLSRGKGLIPINRNRGLFRRDEHILNPGVFSIVPTVPGTAGGAPYNIRRSTSSRLMK